MYDITTQSCSTAELSEARSDISAIAAGNKIFFGGARLVMEPFQQRLLTFTMLLQIHGLLLH